MLPQEMTIGKSCFRYRDTDFRLCGFLFIYKLSDGEKLTAFCHPNDANGVHGYSVCGCTAEFSDIEILERTTKWDDETLREEQKSNDWIVDDKVNQMRLKWLKFMAKIKQSGTMSMKTYDLLAENQFMTKLGLAQHSPVPYK